MKVDKKETNEIAEEIKENKNKKVSNKKAIIAIIAIIGLLAILGIVFATLFKGNNSGKMQNKEVVKYSTHKDGPEADFKPIIYLYPIEETNVDVKVGRPENLTHTYPKYIDSWNVTAKPNGDLVDLKTGRNLYALYWEGINTVKPNMSEGFVVKGEDTIRFLEEKLEILGLNEKEAEEFIVYWLPKLESNKYNFIRFQTEEEINENMPLEITPKPDTIIRILMEFKELGKPMEVIEQQLKTPERKGFTVVEWGGTEIK